MGESKTICDFYCKSLSIRNLKKKKDVKIKGGHFFTWVIPLLIFYILLIILMIYNCLWLSILTLFLLAIYFAYIIRIKDFGKVFVIEDGVEYLLYDYKKKELVDYLTKEHFISSDVAMNHRFYERLIDDCKDKSSILSDSLTLSVFGILIILYNVVLTEISWPHRIVLTFSMISFLIILHILRKIYYSSSETGSFKRLGEAVKDLSLSNLKMS